MACSLQGEPATAPLGSFVVRVKLKEDLKMPSKLIRPLGFAAASALLSLAACGNRVGYSGDNYGDGGYYVDQSMPDEPTKPAE